MGGEGEGGQREREGVGERIQRDKQLITFIKQPKAEQTEAAKNNQNNNNHQK